MRMKDVQVVGTQYQEVYVNPLDVISRLFMKYTGSDNAWVEETKDGKYQIVSEIHKFSKERIDINKETYEFLKSLQTVERFLQQERS